MIQLKSVAKTTINNIRNRNPDYGSHILRQTFVTFSMRCMQENGSKIFFNNKKTTTYSICMYSGICQTSSERIIQFVVGEKNKIWSIPFIIRTDQSK